MIKKQLFKFILVGGLSASVNIGSRVFYNIYVNYTTAIIIAFFTALTIAFILNKHYVFEKSIHKYWIIEYYYFFIVNIFGLVQTMIISLFLSNYFFDYISFNFCPELIAHSIGVIVPVFTSFIGHKYFSFRTSNK